MTLFTKHRNDEETAAEKVVEVQGLDDPEKMLLSQLELAKEKRRFYRTTVRAVPVLGVVVFVICLAIAFVFLDGNSALIALGALYLAVSILFPLLRVNSNADIEVESIENELLLHATGIEAIEQRSERLFKSHELELRRYYGQALKQNSLIFYAGLLCALLGFSVVLFIIYFLFVEQKVPAHSDKLLVAGLGTVSGILTNFVAMMLIKMFFQASQSLNTFHDRLVRTNHLYFSSYLLSKITNIEERERVLGELALASVDVRGKDNDGK